MYNYLANEASQRRQSDYDPPRYAVDGGRVFAVNAMQNSQTNSAVGRTHSSNTVVQNQAAGGMYMAQATQSSSSHVPTRPHQSQSTGQRSMASTSTTGRDYRYNGPVPVPVTAVQQQRQFVTPVEQLSRQASQSSASALEQYFRQHAQQIQPAPPSNWSLPAPTLQPTFPVSGGQQHSLASGGHPQGYVAAAPQMPSAQAPPVVFPNSAVSSQPSFPREASAAVFGTSPLAVQSTSGEALASSSSIPAVPMHSTSKRESITPLPLPAVSEAEAALLPVRGALEDLWGTISAAHTAALAKERDAHIASVKLLNAERKANAQLQMQLQEQMKIQQELRIAAKGSTNEPSLSEETLRRVHSAIELAREEGRNLGRKEGRQELNALQLDFEGVQAELSDQKNLVVRLKAEIERLRCALRASDRLVAYNEHEVLRLLLEIPPTRQDAVLPQCTEDKARMDALIQGIDVVQGKLSDHKRIKQKVTDLVQMVNMDLLGLVDNWKRRGADVLLSSRWKKAWTVAAVTGQDGVGSARHSISGPASGLRIAAPITPRKDSMAIHPSPSSLLVHSRMSASASPSISRKVSISSSATAVSTPPASSSATTLPASGSSHATAINVDLDLDDTSEHVSFIIPESPSQPPSPTAKYRGLLDVIAEARQNFGLSKTSKVPAAGIRTDTDALTSLVGGQGFRSAYGLMALPPTPRDFADPDPSDPDYDTQSVPRLSPPAEDNISANQEPSLSQREQGGWRLRTPSPPPTAPAPPTTPAKNLASHVPSSPCVLKDAIPLTRVTPTAVSPTSPVIVDADTPLCFGEVDVPPVIRTSAGGVTNGKRTRAEFEEDQDTQPGSRAGSLEAERKRRAPFRSSLPPTLIKPECLGAVNDQTAALSLERTLAPEEEAETNELEGDSTEFAQKPELEDEGEDEDEDEDDTMSAYNDKEPSPEPPPTEEACPRISGSTTLNAATDDLEEGEITPDPPVQQTPPPPPSLPLVSSTATDAPSAASVARKQRPIPDMVRRTRPSDHSQAPTSSAPASQHQSPTRPQKAKYTKLGISHIDLLYRTSGHNLICRMCETRPRDGEKKTLTLARYPVDSPWDILIGHCRRDHPVACEELERKRPSDIAEIRQRLPGSRFGRS